MVTVLRPLSTSELLDRTFHLYRNHFVLFLGISAIPQLGVLVLRLAGAPVSVSSPFTGIAIILVAAFASFVTIYIAHAATVVAVSELHLDRAASITGSYSAAQKSLGRVIWISLAVGIAAGIGMLFLIVPGVYLYLMWSLAIPVTVLEGGGLSTSTNRSQSLTKNSRGKIFVICLLLILLTIVVSVIIELPLDLLANMLAKDNPALRLGIAQATKSIGTFISTSLVGPLLTIALTLVYYDQRVRKEGFDLQLMMAALQPGQQQSAAAGNS